MENLISKELLSKVLDNEVPYQIEVHKIIIKNNSLNYYYNSKDSRGELFEANEYINIYELAHKCKEWAFKQGYLIGLNARQGITLIDIETNMVLRYITFDNLKQIIRFELNLCEWILEHKESK